MEYQTEGLKQMLFSIQDPLKNFKKNEYEKSFRSYEEKFSETMDEIEEAYGNAEDPAQLLEELAMSLVLQVQEQLQQKKNQRQREKVLMDYNMSIVIYLSPALIDHNKESGRPLMEELLRRWKAAFPKTNLKVSTFEEINSGVRNRYCYITTAVCENLGKPDDCYELNLLRDYRDGYLQQTEEGEQLIRKYYDVAPTIVKHINQRKEKDQIYQDIFASYLSPCIQLIENHENEKCRVLYQDMVDTLTKKYLLNQEDIHHESGLQN